MKSVRLIHLYPNRRLYDLTASHYVTHADVLKLIRKGIDFEVVDSVRGKDHTDAVLVEILVNEELRSPVRGKLLPPGLLLELIRAGSGHNGREIRQFLSFSLRSLSEQEGGGPNIAATQRPARDARRRGQRNSESRNAQQRPERP